MPPGVKAYVDGIPIFEGESYDPDTGLITNSEGGIYDTGIVGGEVTENQSSISFDAIFGSYTDFGSTSEAQGDGDDDGTGADADSAGVSVPLPLPFTIDTATDTGYAGISDVNLSSIAGEDGKVADTGVTLQQVSDSASAFDSTELAVIIATSGEIAEKLGGETTDGTVDTDSKTKIRDSATGQPLTVSQAAAAIANGDLVLVPEDDPETQAVVQQLYGTNTIAQTVPDGNGIPTTVYLDPKLEEIVYGANGNPTGLVRRIDPVTLEVTITELWPGAQTKSGKSPEEIALENQDRANKANFKKTTETQDTANQINGTTGDIDVRTEHTDSAVYTDGEKTDIRSETEMMKGNGGDAAQMENGKTRQKVNEDASSAASSSEFLLQALNNLLSGDPEAAQRALADLMTQANQASGLRDLKRKPV